MYSAATAKYILWVKSTPDVGVAEASHPSGPFRVLGHFPPESGSEAGDINTFVDPAGGSGWLVYSRKPSATLGARVLRLCRMGAELTSLTGGCATVPGSEGLEAPALMYVTLPQTVPALSYSIARSR